jgi:hypothetical protein
MSSSPTREPLTGLILEGERVVGGLNLPDPPGEFMREFKQRYGHLGLRVVVNLAAGGSGAIRRAAKPQAGNNVFPRPRG